MNRSNGQLDAYIQLAKGIKQHKESGKIFVTGLSVAKTVLVEGVCPTVKSAQKTLAKQEISKLANLKKDKVRNFTFNSMNELKLQGVTV